MRRQRVLTTILVIPITLGTVLVAQGLLNYLGPQGWFNRTLMAAHLISSPVRLLHNYWGVFLSLLITGLPFTFLLTLSYVSGVDPALENAAATLGAGAPVAVPHHSAAAVVAGPGDHLLPVLRAGVQRVSVGRSSGRTIRADAGDLAGRLRGCIRAV